jgi:hypothetical protein
MNTIPKESGACDFYQYDGQVNVKTFIDMVKLGKVIPVQAVEVLSVARG